MQREMSVGVYLTMQKVKSEFASLFDIERLFHRKRIMIKGEIYFKDGDHGHTYSRST